MKTNRYEKSDIMVLVLCKGLLSAPALGVKKCDGKGYLGALPGSADGTLGQTRASAAHKMVQAAGDSEVAKTE